MTTGSTVKGLWRPVGNTVLAAYDYEDVNPDYPAGGGNRTRLTYGNDDYVEYSYDEFDRLSQKRYNDTGRVLQYFYSADGSLAKVTYGDENSTSSQTKYLFI